MYLSLCTCTYCYVHVLITMYMYLSLCTCTYHYVHIRTYRSVHVLFEILCTLCMYMYLNNFRQLMEELCEYIHRTPVTDRSQLWRDEEMMRLANKNASLCIIAVSIYPSIPVSSLSTSIYLSVSMYVHIHLSYLSISISLYLSVYLSMFVHVFCLSIYLSISLSI